MATMTDDTGRGLTTGAAARALGVGHATLLEWASKGLVTPKFRTMGGHLRWDLDDLQRQIEEHRVNPFRRRT